MILALTADFAALSETQVLTTRDARLPPFPTSSCQVTTIASQAEERSAIQRLAADADWTVLIAPETASALADRCRLVESAKGRLLSPSAACVEIAANKQTTADLLRRSGIRVPRGIAHGCDAKGLPAPLQFPVVVKPLDGCASERIQLVQSASQWPQSARAMRVEEFVPGMSASVAVLCGPAGNYALPACEQRLSNDGRFKYTSGRLPLAPQLDRRASRLALAATSALPQPLGYLGVDLVLGQATDGSDDRVIEINPRLTTSYVGLRAAARHNLAAAMLAVATGHQPNLSFRNEPVEFTARGADILSAVKPESVSEGLA